MSRSLISFERTLIRPERLRKIDGSFAFLPHRFLRDGFWASLEHHELLLYLLLVLVADRQGMSFYGDQHLASVLRLPIDDLFAARFGLMRKDLLSYDPSPPRYQLLCLPPGPVISPPTRPTPRRRPDPSQPDPLPISQMIREWHASKSKDSPPR